MDLMLLAFCRKLVAQAISSIGEVFSIKTQVSSVDELPQTGKNGDVYLVGPKEDGSYDEYYWSGLNRWELMGSTATNVDKLVTKKSMYEGPDGTGTPENPAEGTILSIVNQSKSESYDVDLSGDDKVSSADNWYQAVYKNGKVSPLYVETDGVQYLMSDIEKNSDGGIVLSSSSVKINSQGKPEMTVVKTTFVVDEDTDTVVDVVTTKTTETLVTATELADVKDDISALQTADELHII